MQQWRFPRFLRFERIFTPTQRRWLLAMVFLAVGLNPASAQVLEPAWLQCIQSVSPAYASLDIQHVSGFEPDQTDAVSYLYRERAVTPGGYFLYAPSGRVFLFEVPPEFNFATTNCFTFQIEGSPNQTPVRRSIHRIADPSCDPEGHFIGGREVTDHPTDREGAIRVAQRVIIDQVRTILQEATALIQVTALAARDDWARTPNGSREVDARDCRRIRSIEDNLTQTENRLGSCILLPGMPEHVGPAWSRFQQLSNDINTTIYASILRHRFVCPEFRQMIHNLQHGFRPPHSHHRRRH